MLISPTTSVKQILTAAVSNRKLLGLVKLKDFVEPSAQFKRLRWMSGYVWPPSPETEQIKPLIWHSGWWWVDRCLKLKCEKMFYLFFLLHYYLVFLHFPFLFYLFIYLFVSLITPNICWLRTYYWIRLMANKLLSCCRGQRSDRPSSDVKDENMNVSRWFHSVRNKDWAEKSLSVFLHLKQEVRQKKKF